MNIDFRKASVLVTGGAGFIGSHLVDALVQRGAKVRVLDDFSTGRRSNLEGALKSIDVMEGDIRDPGACRAAARGMDYVFHQAALGSVPRSIEDPATTLAVNVAGTVQVFLAARDAGVQRIVYASSSSVYGDSTRSPKREGEEGRPLSPYALSKRMCEELADTFARCYGNESVGLRYFNVFGTRQDPSGPYAAVVPRFFEACQAGQSPTIYGDGNQRRDFTHISDVVEANLLAAQAPPEACGRAYNVGAGHSISVQELAGVIGDITGCKAAARHEPARAGDVAFSLASTELALAALGFRARTSLADGLRTMVGR